MKKYITSILLLLLISSGCELFQNNSESDYGHCNKELLEIVKEKGSVKVYAEYAMDYTPETELTEAEVEVQRKNIADMHEALLKKMEGFYTSGVNKMKASPRIAMFVDKEALEFLCTCELIEKVRKVELGTTF